MSLPFLWQRFLSALDSKNFDLAMELARLIEAITRQQQRREK